MPKTGAIVLAAGLSTRMGAANKLLLPWRDRTVVRAVVQTYLEAIDGEVTVVTGFQAAGVEVALEGLPVRFAHNAAFKRGQPFSVAEGLRQAPDADALLIGLGDQPTLHPSDLHLLLKVHAAEPNRITVPVRGAARGNPIVVPEAMRPRLLSDPDRPGCMRFTRSHPELVTWATLYNEAFFADIDTPEAYQAALQTQKEMCS